MEEKRITKDIARLRRRAEKMIRARKDNVYPTTAEDNAKLIQELQVHHIELELQGEELRDTLRELEVSRDKYLDLFDFAPVAYFTLSKANIIQEVNLSGCRLLGIERSAVKRNNLRFTQYVADEAADSFYLCRREAQSRSTPVTCEMQMRNAQGTSFAAHMELLAFRTAPEDAGKLRVAVVDITERKRAEQLKDKFIGMVSHELRTPLTVIMGAVKVARSESLSTEAIRSLLEDAEYSAEALARLLDNLVELSKYQAHRMQLSKTPVDMASLARKVVDRVKMRNPGRSFAIDIAEELPRAEADRLRVEQVLYNLLDNAAKYSPVDTEVRISVKEEDDHLLIGVSDKGPGLSAEEQARLFQPFQRLEQVGKMTPGMGLGLLVSKRLVEVQGGKIWVESKPGNGSTFWFTLPTAT